MRKELLENQPYNEKELLLGISEGDEKMFGQLVDEYGGQIFPFLVKFTGSPVIAEDLSQDVFLKVWLKRDKLHEINDFKGWLFTVTTNTAQSWLRRKLLERKYMAENALPAADTGIQAIDLKELDRLVQKAVQNLPPKRRQVYLMQRVNKMKIAEVAEALNISPNTVKNTTVAAVQDIREYLKAHGITLSLYLFVTAVLF
jgi:RNA polymerase sigma-70 factor (ECF subfamily)